jgi:hypothetical protein
LTGDEEFRGCCDTTHDFLRRLVRDREGEPTGESDCFTASVRPRSAFLSILRSADGSLLLLEKGRNLEERRETLLGLSWGISTPAMSGASSEEGLDPSELLSDVRSSLLPISTSSSEPLLSSATGDSVPMSLTCGKYVYDAALGNWAR